MDTDMPQLPGTKRSLVEGRLEDLTTKYRRDLALDLLSGRRVGIPVRWLTTRQRRFMELDADTEMDSSVRAAALDLVGHVERLCGTLVPALIDDFLRRRPPGTVDSAGRREIRRRGDLVCEAIFRTCTSWPPAEPERLARTTRAAVDRALQSALELHRARRSPDTPAGTRPRDRAAASSGAGQWPLNRPTRARRSYEVSAPTRRWWPDAAVSRATGAAEEPGLVLRPDQPPADDRDLEDRHLTRATSSDAMALRYNWLETRRDVRTYLSAALGVAAVAALAVVYVALVLVLRRLAPELPVGQDLQIVAAAFGASGLGLAGQYLWTRLRRGRGGGDGGPDQAAASGPSDAPACAGRDDGPAPPQAHRRRGRRRGRRRRR